MAQMVTVKCQHCHQPFEARVADRKRGWGRFCTKSCKASEQELRTGQYATHLRHQDVDDDYEWGHPFESGDGGHGQE